MHFQFGLTNSISLGNRVLRRVFQFNSNFASTNAGSVPRKMDGIWNQIEVAGKTMRQSISDWWAAPNTAPAAFMHDYGWNATGAPPPAGWPPKPTLGHPPAELAKGEEFPGFSWSSSKSVENYDDKIGAPKVPWYTSHFFTNRYCVGYPWY